MYCNGMSCSVLVGAIEAATNPVLVTFDKVQNHLHLPRKVLTPLTWKCAATTACTFSTSECKGAKEMSERPSVF